MPAKKEQTAEELRSQARFIFEGTVQKLGASTMASVPANSNTAIVLVGNVLQAPQALADYNGKEITVQMGGKQQLAEGQQAVFTQTAGCTGTASPCSRSGSYPYPTPQRPSLLGSRPCPPRRTKTWPSTTLSSANPPLIWW